MMAVYVDDMKARFRRMIMCHMIADTENEIHMMATRIGVARRWYQGDHYDICLAMRAQAVRHGAIEITQRVLAAMNMRRRMTGILGSPADADAWAHNYFAAKKVQTSERN